MNKKDLYQAIGDLDESTLDVKSSPRRHYGRWLGSIAALLVLAAGIGWYVTPPQQEPPLVMQDPPAQTEAQAVVSPMDPTAETREQEPAATQQAPDSQDGFVTLSSPVYPQMTDYPLTHRGMAQSEEDYDAWKQDILSQTRQGDYAASLDPFFQKAMASFLSGDPSQNHLCSPANIYMALSMLAEITDGDSRQEILSLLGAESLEALRTQAEAVWNAQYHNDKATYMILANSMWLNEDLKLNQETLNNLSDYYYAASFAGNPGSAQMDQALRDWINEQTGGLLSQQAEDIRLDPNTVMALASTLRYQAKWVAPFREGSTRQRVFNSPTGPETLDFLHQDLNSTYYWGEGFGAVPLNLQNGGGTMWLILPEEGTSTQALLSGSAIFRFLEEPMTAMQKNATIHLALPRFDAAASMDLSEGLQNMGVRHVFSQDADFTPIIDPDHPDGLKPALTQCNHAVRVAVDEEGVTAAAYTQMGMTSISAPPPQEVDFILDRPFLFVIQSNDGLPLFAGQINHP